MNSNVYKTTDKRNNRKFVASMKFKVKTKVETVLSYNILNLY